MTLNISQAQARSLALSAQWLIAPRSVPGKAGVLKTIEYIGYVQIDTISVIQRAHHHTLWSRVPGYQPQMLDELLRDDRKVFEYWGHAASYLPMKDYRFYLPMMRRFSNPSNRWMKNRLEQYGHLMDPVLKRIREEGPLSSHDFKPPPGYVRGNWWNWKPAKNALELLFWQGKLMIRERKGFQRVYDLTERVLPPNTDLTLPTQEEITEFTIKRCLQAHGLADSREITDHIHLLGKNQVESAIKDLVDAGSLVSVNVEGQPDKVYVMLAEAAESVPKRKMSDVLILSPFDNLVIQRKRVKDLFGLDYTLECYVPAAKRKFGYFSLPVFWKNQPVGLMDAKAHRQSQQLQIKTIQFIEKIPNQDRFWPHFCQKLHAFAQFNGCPSVKLDGVIPLRYRDPLEKHLME